MRKLRLLKFVGLFLAIIGIFTLALGNSHLSARRSCLSNLVAMELSDGSYLYTFLGCQTSFTSSVKNGGTVSGETVTLKMSENCCTVGKDCDAVKCIVNSNEKDKIFVFDQPGDYNFVIGEKGVLHLQKCARFGFTIKTQELENDFCGNTDGLIKDANSQIIYKSLSNNAATRPFKIWECFKLNGIIKKCVAYADEPVVKNIELSGIYHKEFGTYEVAVGGKFFYSSIGNGGVAKPPAYFDVPDGVNIEMEKDGTKIAFKNKTYITGLGSYKMVISTMEDDIKYVGNYRFRLQDGSLVPAATGSVGGSVAVKEGAIKTVDGVKTAVTDVNQMVTLEGGAIDLSGSDKIVGLKETCDLKSKLFVEQSAKGLVFTSTIPNGAIINDPVYFVFPKDIDIVITKNNESVDYVPGAPIVDEGIYVLKFKPQKETLQLSDGNVPVFTFRIIKNPVKDLTIYNAPKGFKILNVKYEDEKMESGGKTFWLGNDGKYEISVVNEASAAVMYVLTMTRDTKGPVFTVDGLNDNGVLESSTLNVLTDDEIGDVFLYKNGSAVTFKHEIEDAGEYRLVVFDVAGNSSEINFIKKYSLSGFSLSALIVLVSILLLAIVYFIYNRVRKVVR